MLRSLVFLFLFLIAAPVRGQVGVDSLLGEALRFGQSERVAQLVGSNRLEIKPIVDERITRALRAGRSGLEQESERLLDEAKTVARTFEMAFGEASLLDAVDSAERWSPEDRVVKLRADSLEALGTALRAVASTREESLVHFQAALELYTRIGDLRGIAQAKGGIGYLHWSLDRSRYLELNLEALEARFQSGDRQLIANTLYDVGLAYQYVERNPNLALSYYRRSDSMRVAIGDSLALNRMLPAVASLYRSVGDLPRARQFYERSIRAHELADDQRRLAVSERNLGVLISYMGLHSEALPHLFRARAIHEARGERADVGPVVNWLGVVYRRLGDYDRAVEAYQESIALAREMEDGESLGWAYNNLGVVLAYADRYERATTYYDRALAQFREEDLAEGILDATLNIADSYYELESYGQAEEFGRRALALADSLGDPTREGRALGTLANVFARTERVAESDSAFAELTRLARFTGMTELEWGALLHRASLEAERGEQENALRDYEQAFVAMERTRTAQLTDEDKTGYLAQQRYAFEEYIHYLGQLHESDPGGGHLARGFEFAERGKARAFLDLLAEAIAEVGTGVDADLLARQDSLLRVMAAYQPQGSEDGEDLAARVDSLERAYDLLRREIRTSNPEYAELRDPTTATLADVQRSLLDEDSALLEYSVGDSSSTLWVVTSGGAEMFSLPDRPQIQESVELLRFALADPDRRDAAEYAQLARGVYDLILKPAEEVLAGLGHLIIVPDDVLHYVPFEALVTESGLDSTYSDLAYLIDRVAVSYAPSASVLLQLRGRDRAAGAKDRKQLLAFGDPEFRTESSLARLPWSGEEVRVISDLFESDQTDVFLAGAATEQSAKRALDLSGYRYVHFATHGLINEGRPDFSGLALAADGAEDEDGFLQAAEVFNLHIDADLVILSACETGLGRLVRGEGLVGLTRAFMYAGTPSMVVSLWSVADQSTADLMGRLYTRLSLEDSKDTALRDAKREMIADGIYAHPFHWAPFVLTGSRL
ncbi:MAG: CHAT domain-containing protein/tetratricopeptide (TPR) repeat protein [Rhodothermales bacterium]|jgi:CHAT domain-containing protein/tetratricopeptide (TPR) repeat protein